MTNSTISNNAAPDGAGVWNATGTTAALTATVISGNAADPLGGGGIANRGTMTLVGSTVAGNSATLDGGGIWSNGTLTLERSSVSGNTASPGTGGGGGIRNADGGALTLTNSTISSGTVTGNTSGNSGGGLFGQAGGVEITGTAISGNTATVHGGGVWAFAGTLDLTDSTVSENNASELAGGIGTNFAVVNVVSSSVSGNTAGSAGGGLYSEVTLILTNSTVSGNTSTGPGGGIRNEGAGTVALLNATISGNSAGAAGGIDHSGQSTTLRNAIVAGNTPTDCQGPVLSFGSNLDGDNSCNLIAPGDVAGGNAGLGPLADNGGLTQTHALLPGSAAINAGNDGVAPAIDQRGVARVGPSDIGDFEFQGADADGDGFDALVASGMDCDDGDASIFPGAVEVAGDGIDQDCDGADLIADADGDGLDALAAGGTDCDDGDASVFPGAVEVAGDGIDQDCDGADLVAEDEPVLVTVSLVGGFNAVVFTGADATPIAEVAEAIGPALKAVFRFDASGQRHLSYRPDAPIPALNTLVVVNQRDVLFVLLAPGANATFTWPDLLPDGSVTVSLPPGYTFIGYTGADGAAIGTLLAATPGVSAAFLFEILAQSWLVSRPGQPSFLSSFLTADRLSGLFILNPTAAALTLSWQQVAGGA